MKPAALISILQTFVLVVVAYKWINLEQEKLTYNNFVSLSEEFQAESKPQIPVTQNFSHNRTSNKTTSLSSDQVRSIIRDELRVYSTQLELSRKPSENLSNNEIAENSQLKFEQLGSQLEFLELGGTMRQSDMEELFIELASLSKGQRKTIRNRLTKAINSGKINLIK